MTTTTDYDAPTEAGGYDRTPPYNLQAEQSVLGGMILSKDAITEATEKGLRARDFYQPKHATIYTAILALNNANEPTDPVSVAAHLLGTGDLEPVGGVPYLHTLANTVPTAANAAYYAGIVAEDSLARQIVEVGTRIVQLGYGQGAGAGEKAPQRLDLAQAALHELTVSRARSQVIRLGEVTNSVLEMAEAAGRGMMTGLPTGFTDLDRLLGGGLHPGNLALVAGRPGMGKSVMGVDIARHVAIKQGKPVLFFSLEMSKEELTQRILSAEARVPLHLIKAGGLDDDGWTRLARKSADLDAAPFYFDDVAGQTMMQIKATSRRFMQQHGLELIVIDYLQKIRSAGRIESRQQEVTQIADELKNLAKELKIPVVALCQLNRNLEGRTDKRPQLSDLRESGSLEQEADVVMFIHRDDYYDKECARSGEGDIIVAKQRSGATDTITVAAQLHLSQFVDMAIV